jgi:hypothetical protein
MAGTAMTKDPVMVERTFRRALQLLDVVVAAAAADVVVLEGKAVSSLSDVVDDEDKEDEELPVCRCG